MSIESKHPDFLEVADDYRVMRDSFAGERRIKEALFLYLPPTGGQVTDGALRSTGSDGFASYTAYVKRANYPEFVKEAVNTLVGVMHAEPALIELPSALEPMRNNATRKGETLDMLLRKINEQQLRFGRFGMLADFPQDEDAAAEAEVPHIVEYEAETIINWDDERFTEFAQDRLSFAVLNETVFVRGEQGASVFDWMEERRFRVLKLGPDPEAGVDEAGNPLGDIVYQTFVENDDVRSELVVPKFKGRVLDEIPWVFVGANDLCSTPDEIPLLGLANLSLAIYRGDADYRQALHLLGQDTLVIIGDEVKKDGETKEEEDETRIGAGAVIRIIAGEGAGAEFIGIDSKGVPEQKKALDTDMTRAGSMGARLLEPRGSQAESGEALRIRVSASTATLQTIALTGSAALERILRICAEWVGANPDEVKIKPNLDFTQESPNPEGLRAFAQARKEGAPISLKSMHLWAQDKNLTKMSYEQELMAMLGESARAAADDAGEKTAGRTDVVADHDHGYVFITLPDGTVYGITDTVAGHFHVIRSADETEAADVDNHIHKILEGEAPDEAPADDEPEGSPGSPGEADSEAVGSPGEADASSTDA